VNCNNKARTPGDDADHQRSSRGSGNSATKPRHYEFKTNAQQSPTPQTQSSNGSAAFVRGERGGVVLPRNLKTTGDMSEPNPDAPAYRGRNSQVSREPPIAEA